MPFVAPRSLGTPNLPQQFWGRCEPKRAEGACPSRGIIGFIALLLLAICIAPPLAAQTVISADTVAVASIRVEPDSSITVGDRFRAAVFVRAPAGARVELVVPPAADGAYQTVDSIRTYAPDSTGLHRAVATMVLWTADPPAAARGEVRITLPDGGVEALRIGIPLPATRAVLPADSTQPRPPKDIIPIPQRSWTWAWIVAAVLLIALLVWWIMHRRRSPRVAPADPRGHALAELDRLRASSPIERDVEAFSAGMSAILREFAAAVDPALGTDLTTQELLDHLRRTGAHEEDVESVAGALMHADLAKFARRQPTPERALHDWEAARRWVQTFRAEQADDAPVLADAGAGR